MVPHGHISTKWHNNSLYVKAEGPFNIEGAQLALEKIKKVVTNNAKPMWKRMDIVNNDTLGEPLVMRVFGESYLWAFNNGCQATAFVFSNTIQEAMLEQLITQHKVNMKAFSCEEAARCWLKAF